MTGGESCQDLTVDEEDLRRVVMDVEPQNPGTEKKQAAVNFPQPLENNGAGERGRTSDLLITNQPLYRLSYAGPMDASEKTGKEL